MVVRQESGNPINVLRDDRDAENDGDATLYCVMEGDAGAFQITPAKNGEILIAGSRLGMGFENDTAFATLAATFRDDRSFLLGPQASR